MTKIELAKAILNDLHAAKEASKLASARALIKMSMVGLGNLLDELVLDEKR